MATEDLKTQAGWDAFVRRHNGNVGSDLAPGQERLSNGQVRDTKTGAIIPPEKVHFRYTLGDGSTIDINQEGDLGPGGLKENAPSVATGTKNASGDWSQTEYRDIPGQAGQEQKWGISPVSGQFEPMPGTQRPKEQKVAGPGQLQRWDRNGQIIRDTDTTTPVAKVYDPVKGTAIDMPDPKTSPNGEYREVGGNLYLLKAGEQPQLVISAPDKTKPSTFQGADGAQWEYDPSKPEGQRAHRLTEAKPDVAAQGQILYRPIPGTNGEQGYRVVDGKVQDIEGLTKPRTTTMLGDASSQKLSFIDAQGNVTRTIDNPVYKEKKTDVTATGALPFTVERGDQGLTYSENRNYQPTTAAQVAGRVEQLQQMMQAKGAELQKQIGENYTHEQFTADFGKWYDENIASQRAYLSAAQQQIEIDRAQKAEEARRAAMATAVTVGNQAVSAYQAQAPYRVGSRAAEVAQQVAANKSMKGVDLSNSVFRPAPNLQEVAEKATANALKNISGLAAQQAGGEQPNYGSIDVNSVLSRDRWNQPGVPPVVRAAAAGPQPDLYAGMQTTPFRTFAPPQGGGPNGSGQGIGNDPMANAFAMYQRDQDARAAAAPGPAPVAAAAPAPAPVTWQRPSAPAPTYPIGSFTPGAPTVPSGPVPTGGTVPSLGYEVPTVPPTPTAPGLGFDPSSMWAPYGNEWLNPGAPYGQAGLPSVSGLGTYGTSQTGVPQDWYGPYQWPGQ